MKKIILLFLVMLTGILYASEDKSITDIYNDAIYNIYPNRAKSIILGNIDLLDEQISDFDLAKLSNEDLRILRNIIYAKHGNIFSSNDLNEYFTNFSWYKPVKKISDSQLTEKELELIKRILIFEKRNENTKNIKIDENVGVYQLGYWGVASGWGDRFVFYSGNQLDFIFSQMRSLYMALEYHGSYEIKGNVLIFYVNEILYNDITIDYKLYTNTRLDDSTSYQKNRIIFDKPEIYKFPIIEFDTKKTIYRKAQNSDTPIFQNAYFELGSNSYYRVTNDTNQKY